MKNSLLYLISAMILCSCNRTSNKEVNNLENLDGSEMYNCVENRFSDFVVLSSSLDKNQKPNTSTYVFKGTLKNNTQNTYKGVTFWGELILILENGNELSCSDINYAKSLLGDGIALKYKSNWKPNEEWIIPKIETCKFSIEYFDYPVKEVYTQYFMELEDQINNTKTKILISRRDVTKKWMQAKIKVINRSIDCSDNSIEFSQFMKKY